MVVNALVFLYIFLSEYFREDDMSVSHTSHTFGFMCFSSAECQTVHWRQGHKFECRPLSKIHQSDDVISDIGTKAAEQEDSGIHEKPESEGTECKAPSEKPSISDISLSPKLSFGKDDNIRVGSLAEGNLTDSNSELSSNSFSGFSASTCSSDSSDDSSVCESVISNEHDRSEGHIFVVPTLDIPDKISSNNCMGVAMSSSPKFASLLDSVDGVSTIHNLNHITPGSSKEERKLASNGALGSSTWKGVKIEPSGFWDKALHSRGVKDDANNDTCLSHSNEFTGEKTDSGPSFHFPFSTMPPLRVQDTKAKDSLPEDALPNSVGNDIPHAGSASSENDNSKGSNFTRRRTPSGSESDQLESKHSSEPPLSSISPQSSSVRKDPGSADSLSIHNLQSAGSKAANHVVDSHCCTLKSTDIRCPACGLANSNLASRTEEHSNPRTKHGNNSSECRTVSSSQVPSCSANSKSGLKTSVLKVVDQFRGSNLSKRIPLAVGSDIAGRYSDKVLLEQIFLCSFFALRHCYLILIVAAGSFCI